MATAKTRKPPEDALAKLQGYAPRAKMVLYHLGEPEEFEFLSPNFLQLAAHVRVAQRLEAADPADPETAVAATLAAIELLWIFGQRSPGWLERFPRWEDLAEWLDAGDPEFGPRFEALQTALMGGRTAVEDGSTVPFRRVVGGSGAGPAE